MEDFGNATRPAYFEGWNTDMLRVDSEPMPAEVFPSEDWKKQHGMVPVASLVEIELTSDDVAA